MPSQHIPEEDWTRILLAHDGDREAAREEVKDAVAERADELAE